jgi:hypothetical protein
MKKFFFATIALAAAMAIMPSAKADAYNFVGVIDPTLSGSFNFNESGNSIASGTLDIVTGGLNFSAGIYTYVVGSGTYNVGGPIVASYTNGTITDTLEYFDGPSGWEWNIENSSLTNQPLAVQATPEPSSLILLGSGLFLLAGGLFAKSRSTSSAKQTGLTLA